MATRFENLILLESETIVDFNAKLWDIANEAFALDEKYFETKLVRKTLRSLPERFTYKVIAIEEAQDVSAMRLDELIGSLQTFEMSLKQKKKYKSIALHPKVQDSSDEEIVHDDADLTESLA